MLIVFKLKYYHNDHALTSNYTHTNQKKEKYRDTERVIEAVNKTSVIFECIVQQNNKRQTDEQSDS